MHCSEKARLEGLRDLWYGKAHVGDGADVVERADLDAWQKFAHDIVMDSRHTDSDPLRMMLMGSAGTGKSRTVRSFVSSKRKSVKEEWAGPLQRAELGADADACKKVKDAMDEHVRNSCLLAAPTGCASFQLKFGASTLHRVFGIPVGYCGPWKDRSNERFLKIKTRMH